jgi:hypothetical protein
VVPCTTIIVVTHALFSFFASFIPMTEIILTPQDLAVTAPVDMQVDHVPQFEPLKPHQLNVSHTIQSLNVSMMTLL